MPTRKHSPAHAATSSAPPRDRGRGLLVVVAVALGLVTAMLNVTVANVALVAIKDDPSPALRALAWIGDAYMADLRAVTRDTGLGRVSTKFTGRAG